MGHKFFPQLMAPIRRGRLNYLSIGIESRLPGGDLNMILLNFPPMITLATINECIKLKNPVSTWSSGVLADFESLSVYSMAQLL